MQLTDIKQILQDDAICLTRTVFMGLDGLIRAKAVTTSGIESLFASGIGLAKTQASMNIFDALSPQSEYQPVGEVRIVPDPTTFTVLPYLPGHARILSNLVMQDGQPWDLCARSLLQRVLAQFQKAGLTVQVAFESEFTLYEPQGDAWVPCGTTPSFSSASLDEASLFILAVIDALDKQGIQVEKCYSEAAPGQFEFPMRHQMGLLAADQQVIFRETVRGVALAQGKRVSFMPKPDLQAAGNGCHIHISLWNQQQRNLLYDPSNEFDLSSTGRHFIAGILDHIQALLAFTAPTMNAYQRFKPQNWASFCRCWGPDNREATVRLASSFSHAPEQTLNLEYRVADPTCNPYLALSAVLLAGWSGITRKLEPAPAVVCNPVHLSVEDQAHYGIQLYPVTLAQALDALAKDQLLSQAIGPHLVQEYELMKRLEIKMVQSLGEHGEQHAYQFLF